MGAWNILWFILIANEHKRQKSESKIFLHFQVVLWSKLWLFWDEKSFDKILWNKDWRFAWKETLKPSIISSEAIQLLFGTSVLSSEFY